MKLIMFLVQVAIGVAAVLWSIRAAFPKERGRKVFVTDDPMGQTIVHDPQRDWVHEPRGQSDYNPGL